MSFTNCILPKLKGKKITKETWYISQLTKALNEWFKELDKLASAPIQKISGTGVFPYPLQTITVTDTPAMYLKNPSVGDAFKFSEVQNVMWGTGKKCKTEVDMNAAVIISFRKLFELVGKKIRKRWKIAVGNGITLNGSSQTPILFDTTKFGTYGIQFINAVKNPFMTPQLFHIMLNSYLCLAINTMPTTTAMVTGRYNQVYVFTGTVTLKFPTVT